MWKQILSILTLGLLTVGCAHYHTGTGHKPAYTTIAILPVLNESMAPQAQAVLHESLLTSFARGQEISLAKRENADALLQVTLKDYKKSIAASRSDDTGRARSLGVDLVAIATVTKPTGEQIYSQEFTVSYEIYADSGMTRAETEAMPRLAQQLAEKIYRAVSSSW